MFTFVVGVQWGTRTKLQSFSEISHCSWRSLVALRATEMRTSPAVITEIHPIAIAPLLIVIFMVFHLCSINYTQTWLFSPHVYSCMRLWYFWGCGTVTGDLLQAECGQGQISRHSPARRPHQTLHRPVVCVYRRGHDCSAPPRECRGREAR